MAGQKTLCLLLYFVCLTWAELETTEHIGSERSKEMLEQLSTTEELVELICSCRENGIEDVTRPVDCYDVMKMGETTSGIYNIHPLSCGVSDEHACVWCDMETDGGGWTVLQRRYDGSVDFNLGWENYKNGFGYPAGELWLGNDNIHRITNQKDYELLVELTDNDGNGNSTTYDHFRLGNEAAKYTLVVGTSSRSDAFCDQPLGMEDGRIKDSQLTASTNHSTSWNTRYARLNYQNKCWLAKTNDGNQWIQVKFDVPKLVTGVVTQGKPDSNQWVTNYRVQYSEDGNSWLNVYDSNQHEIFDGNTDRSTPVTNFFAFPVKTTYIRIQPTTIQSYTALRFEVFGCEGDSLAALHNYQPFSTKDADNDSTDENCAEIRGPWWYGTCDHSDLNGEYITKAVTRNKGILWKDFQDQSHRLKRTEMKIRPTIRN